MAKKGKLVGKGRRSGGRGGTSGLGGLPQQPRARWSLAMVCMPLELDVAQMFEVVMVFDHQGGVRASVVSLRPAPVTDAAAAFEDAMRRPISPFLPARPVVLAVPAALADAVAPVAQRAGVALAVQPTDHLAAGFIDMARRSGHAFNDATIMGVPPAVELDFAAAAAEFAARAPWRFMGDELVFEILSADRPLGFRFAVVLGSLGEVFGLALYQSMADVEGLANATGAEGLQTPSRALFLLDAEETEEPVRELFAHRRYPLTEDRYPCAVATDGGAHRRELNAEDAAELRTGIAVMAAYFQRTLTAEGFAASETTAVALGEHSYTVRRHQLRDATEFSTMGIEQLCDFDVFTSIIDLPASWASSIAMLPLRTERSAPGEPSTALVLRSTKANITRAMRRLTAPEFFFVMSIPGELPWLVVLDPKGVFHVCALPPRAEERIERLSVAQQPLTLIFSGGGMKRNTGQVRLGDIVGGCMVWPIRPPDLREPIPSPFPRDERFIFEVSIDGIEPRIWRRFALPTDATFAALHAAIQVSGDWGGGHLWEFRAGRGRTAELLARARGTDAWDDDDAVRDNPPLHSFFRDRRARRCGYLYDFGDCWELTIQMKKVEKAPGAGWEFLGGARAFPPEDCGGVSGYEAFAEALDDPEDELADWAQRWDLESFDAAAVREAFAALASHTGGE